MSMVLMNVVYFWKKYFFQLKHHHFFLLLFSAICIISCNKCSQGKARPIVLVTEPEHVNEEVAKLIETQLNDFDTLKVSVIADANLYAIKQVIEFYKKNNFNPIWTDKGKHLRQSDSLIDLIKNSADYGLISNDYHLGQILKLITSEKDSVTKKYDAVKISEVDILLTDALITLAVHVHKGRLNPESFKREWKGEKLDTNIVDVLNDAVKRNAIRTSIDSLEPAGKQYKALKRGLAKFKMEFKDSNWDGLLKSGMDTLTFNERLKQRLIAGHNYFKDPKISDLSNLEKAIKNFQFQHNLTDDGKIGSLTYKALQQTKQDCIWQIEMNMERWRYYDAPNENKFVWINIPKYEMKVIEQDTLVMRSRVIVGNPKMPTPLLKSTIRYFIIYPYWTVPYSIVTKEILPKLKRDTSYLNREHFDVLDRNNKLVDTLVNWNRYKVNFFPFTLRQRIGEDNSLGILKFNFNNKYGVYLHDTNNHKLFSKDLRALSHGCIRLEKSVDFAEYLIRDDSLKYTVDQLQIDLSKPVQKYIYLKRPIPIYVNYFTIEADENNKLFYFMDVYMRDEKMLKELYGK